MVMDMSIKRIRTLLALFLASVSIALLSAGFSYAQESGLGYSEAPFALIENISEAIGTTPLEAIQAASADDEEIFQDKLVQQGNYALLGLTFNDIGISAISQQTADGQWQFVCRAGGLMQPEELVQRCGVPSAIAERLYTDFLNTPLRGKAAMKLSTVTRTTILLSSLSLILAIGGLFISSGSKAESAEQWQPLSELVSPQQLTQIIAENTAPSANRAEIASAAVGLQKGDLLMSILQRLRSAELGAVRSLATELRVASKSY